MRSYIIYIITKYTTQHIFHQLFIDILLRRISHGLRTDNASIRWFFFFFFVIKIQSRSYVRIIFLKKKYGIFISTIFQFSWQRWNNNFNRICNKFSLSHRQIYPLVYYANCWQVYYSNKELQRIIKCTTCKFLIFLVLHFWNAYEKFIDWPDFICRFLVNFFFLNRKSIDKNSTSYRIIE